MFRTKAVKTGLGTHGSDGREEWEGGVARLEKIGGGGVAERDAIIDTGGNTPNHKH